MKIKLLTGFLFGMTLFLLHCAAGNKAQQSYQSKDYSRTLTLCKQAILADSSDTESMILMAKACIQLDSLSEADKILIRALKTGLNDPEQKQDASDLYFKLAECSGKNREVMDYLHKAEELSPKSPEVLERLGSLYEKEGELEEAEVLYEKLVMLVNDPTQYGFITNSLTNKIEFARQAYGEGMRFYNKKEYADALQYFAKAVEVYPGMNEAVYCLNLSRINIIKRNPNKTARKQARKYLLLAADAMPSKAEPHFLMARFYEMENDKNFLDEAIYHYALSYKLESKGPFAEKSRSKMSCLKKRKETLDKFWGN